MKKIYMKPAIVCQAITAARVIAASPGGDATDITDPDGNKGPGLDVGGGDEGGEVEPEAKRGYYSVWEEEEEY